MTSLGEGRPLADRRGDNGTRASHPGGLHHQAAFYGDRASFLAATVPFLQEGLAADEPALVMLEPTKVRELRTALGADSDRVSFADMSTIGRNPARIIPAWRAFVQDSSSHGNQALRGIGEPVWPGRSDAEVVEAQIHEQLLNLAFDDATAMSLLCPYDTSALSPSVIAEATRAHPFVSEDGVVRASNDHDTSYAANPLLDYPLSNPPDHARRAAFDDYELRNVRELVQSEARAVGIDTQRTADLGLSVNELATNSLEHGGGRGTLTVWRATGALICDVSDEGHIDQPLIGRIPPAEHELGGRGLYLANQLCDLVQVRSTPGGTTVRVHMSTGG